VFLGAVSGVGKEKNTCAASVRWGRVKITGRQGGISGRRGGWETLQEKYKNEEALKF